MNKLKLPDLPYDYSALEPAISGDIMRLHHDKHHQAYVTGYNANMDKVGPLKQTGEYSYELGLRSWAPFPKKCLTEPGSPDLTGSNAQASS